MEGSAWQFRTHVTRPRLVAPEHGVGQARVRAMRDQPGDDAVAELAAGCGFERTTGLEPATLTLAR